MKIIESGFKPDLIVGVWRGGTPVAIAIQEALEFSGLKSDHIPIRTSSYTGIAQRNKVQVDGLEYLQQKNKTIGSILLVDDVFDTGLSLEQVIKELEILFQEKMPNLKIATPYYKPTNNQTTRQPDYFLHETDQWLVFPHELIGLSDSEILNSKPGIDTVKHALLALRQT